MTQVCHGFPIQASQPCQKPWWSSLGICLETPVQVAIDALVMAMENQCMDWVDIVRSRLLEQTQQQLVPLLDFLKFY